MWVSPLSASGGGPFAAARLSAERQEIHDLANHLLRVYNGTGKSFYLGNWEGDWLLTHTDPNSAPTTEEVQSMIHWANTRQQAVDDARRDTPHANVHIYYYVEVNRVRDAMNGKVRVANKVLPRTNPDFVSYSSYDAQNGDFHTSEVLRKSQGLCRRFYRHEQTRAEPRGVRTCRPRVAAGRTHGAARRPSGAWHAVRGRVARSRESLSPLRSSGLRWDESGAKTTRPLQSSPGVDAVFLVGEPWSAAAGFSALHCRCDIIRCMMGTGIVPHD